MNTDNSNNHTHTQQRPARIRARLASAGYKLAMVQTMLQVSGEQITDEARQGAGLELDEVREIIVTAMQFM